jgi:pimeloyl-ACP methyl ester carboxylesterase
LRVLRYDRFTYRAGTKPSSGAETMAHEVADVLAIADALDGPLVVVGHSSGAVVALQAAKQRDGSVRATGRRHGGARRRGATACPGGLDQGDPAEAIAVDIGDIVGMQALARFMRVVPPLRSAMSRFGPGQIADDEARESVGVGLDQYVRITTPALLLGGAKSPAHHA